MYRWVAGLTIAESSSPTPHFEIHIPQTRLLNHARASLQTSWGIASVSWKQEKDQLIVEFAFLGIARARFTCGPRCAMSNQATMNS